MKRRWPWVMLVSLVLAMSGGAAWWRLHPTPEPGADDERRFEDIPTDEHEKWLQDLGYTE